MKGDKSLASLEDGRIDENMLALSIGLATTGVYGLARAVNSEQWYRNIILHDSLYSCEQLLEFVYPELAKQNSWKLPVWYYISKSKMKSELAEEKAPHSYTEIVTESTIKRNRSAIGERTAWEVWTQEKDNLMKAIRLLGCMPEEKIDVNQYRSILEAIFTENNNILSSLDSPNRSNLHRMIMYAGRNIRNQLSTYLFNREAVEEYLASVKNEQPIVPPEIMIELYFKSGTLPEYEGNGNSEKSDGIEGIRFTISFSDKFNSEYESLLKTEKITSLPIEFYEAKWFSFSRDEKMPRFIPIKSVMIDSSNYRYQNGSDVYISRVVKDFLEPEDITAITQAHRNMIDEFAQNEAIQSINEKISAASTVMNGKLSLSADQGVQNSWESSLVTQVDGIPFAHAGKGAQCIIKTQLALSHKQAEKASIILIEEPESHLSFSRLSELMGVIEKAASGKQIIASTHSSFVANKLGLENLILLSGDNCCSMQSLKKETFEFFKKVAGYDTLRLILCKKSILVEGDSDELVVQRAYMDTHEGRLPIQDGIDVMTVGGVTFKRYLEIAQTLNKETAVVKAENRLTVDIEGLMAMLSCGEVTAKKIADYAEARVIVGRRVLYNVDKIKKYIDAMAV